MALPTITSSLAVALNRVTGQVYYLKGAGSTVMGASLVKLMTAHVLLQNKTTLAALQQTVTIESSDVGSGGNDLQIGDIITLHQLLANMLIPSSNSSANAIARVIGEELTPGGGRTRFITEMNAYRTSLGMTSTTYNSVHGNSSGNETHPEDVAKIPVLDNAIVREIWGFSVYPVQILRNSVLITSNQTSTWTEVFGSPGLIGGKTGTLSVTFNFVGLWRARNNQEVFIGVQGAASDAQRYVDWTAIRDQLVIDFPELKGPAPSRRTLSNPFSLKVAKAVAEPPIIVVPPVEDGEVPAWRKGRQVNEWYAVPNTSLTYLDSIGGLDQYKARGYTHINGIHWGTAASYSGACIDTRTSDIYQMNPGGHSISHANPVIRIRMSVDNPVWEVHRLPTCNSASCGGSQICMRPKNPDDPNSALGACRRNNDGSPPAVHTYYGNQFIERHNKVVNLNYYATVNGTPIYNMMCSYDPVLREYDPDLTYPDIPLASNRGEQPRCKDPVTEKIYSFYAHGYNSWAIYDPDTNTFSKPPNTPHGITPTSAPVAVDTRRNRIFQPSSSTSTLKPPWVCDLSTHTFTPVELGGLGKIFPDAGWGMPFVQHPTDPLKDAFYLMNDVTRVRGKLYRVNAETFDVDEVATTGTPPIQPTLNASNNIVGIRLFSKLLYMPQFQSLFYWNDGRNNVHVLRVF